MNRTPSLELTVLKQLKIPVLSQDEKWLEIIGAHMNDDMRVLVARQSALVQEEKKSVNQLIQLKRQKKEALSQLLALTAQLQRKNEDAENQAERIKTLLERINEEIDHLQFKIETTPSEINKLNIELLEETISLGYDKLLVDNEKIGVLNIKIQKLRNELLTMNEEKFALEDSTSAVGQFLHSLLGKELSDELDSSYRLTEKDYIL